MAMLMMPERSPTRPHIAPKISGTDRARAPASRVVIGITPPDPPPAQARKETTNSTPKSIGNQEPRLIPDRSEEHTSELQSRGHLVCRLLLEKKKNKIPRTST